MKSTSNLLMRGAFWIGATRVAVNLMGLASTIILARLLVPEDFGLVAIATALAAVIQAVTELSLSQALVQHADPEEDHFHTAWTMNVLRAAILGVLIAALGWPAAYFYAEPRLIEIMIGFGIANVIGGFINPRLALFERRLEFKQWVFLSGGEKLAGFVVSAGIAFVFRSYWALVVGVLASQLTRVIVSYALISYRPRPRLSHYRDLLNFSIWLTFGQAVQAINWRANPLLLAAFLPTPVVGSYNVASRVSSLAVNEVLEPVNALLFPAFSRLQSERERLRAAYIRTQGLLALLSFPVGCGLAAVAAPTVLLVLGEQWRSAIPIVQFLAIAAVIQRQVQLSPLAMATANTKQMFGRDVRALIIRLPLVLGGLAFGPSLGVGSLFGALIGHTLSSLLNALLNMQLVAKIIDLGLMQQMKQIWRPAVAGTLMALCVAGALARLPEQSELVGQIAMLIGAVAAGGVLYVGIVALLWLIAGRPAGAETEAVDTARKVLGRLRSRGAPA
ncbi:lipopolysaccharide biosynthesis protein [Qipengyuania spongiae]|uniref:Lipopolysaccharide biosynthesis protein n=1 Tax=Qipengyuania spongiae TaxID=2909673 RepID=A0ABY5SXQ1_9SPHN|nr:lipopolysaccharide biosynthesis protein [Qipengyuania spongiae]UVI39100.1 lipopolysaccharide biosynthesis protein [Qipengyuania spongiae]